MIHTPSPIGVSPSREYQTIISRWIGRVSSRPAICRVTSSDSLRQEFVPFVPPAHSTGYLTLRANLVAGIDSNDTNDYLHSYYFGYRY